MVRVRHILSLVTVLSVLGCDGRFPTGIAGSTGPTPAPSSATGGLEGTAKYEGVFDSQAGITVQLTGGVTRATVTDGQGRYRFGSLPAGSYTLAFSRSRYAGQTQGVTVADATVSASTVTLSNHRLLYSSPLLYDAPNSAPTTSLVLSPDRTRLAFVEGGRLKTVALDGTGVATVRDFRLASGEAIDSFDWSARGLAYAYVATGSTPLYSLCVTSGADPAGAVTVATSSHDLTISPAYSPDGASLAYLARVSEAWTTVDASGSVVASGNLKLAINRLDVASGAIARLADYPVNKAWNFGFGPIQWSAAGILFHKPMFCNLRYGEPTGDGLYLLNPVGGGLTKLFYYSWYEHCLANDAQTVYFHTGRTLYGRKVNDPGNYSQGAFAVGYDATSMMASLVMGPAGDRVYYVSGRGIEEMQLLR